MNKFKLNIDPESHRVLSVCFAEDDGSEYIIDAIPEGDIHNFIFENGKLVSSPLPIPPAPKKRPSELQVLKGIVSALAMVTGHAEVLKNGKF